MKPFQIKNDIFWIGALHPDLRLFDIIMRTKNGTTYNSYLIRDEKIAIIDTVKEKFAHQYISHIKELVDPGKIEYIIAQHTEPDHTGSLTSLLEIAPNAQIVCAKVAVKYVENTINREAGIIPVENNSTLSLGTRTLRFLSTPFLHWPDTMMTYSESDEILFPCDVFASHFCDSRMFDDTIARDFRPDFRQYFEVILRPYKRHLRNALKKIEPLTIKTIAPSHGPILRKNIADYINCYKAWAAVKAENKPKRMLIYYASAHGNTEKMANKIAEGARSVGLEVELFDACTIHPQDHLERIENADALVFGSPTINNDVVKPIWDILTSLATIDIKGKVGASFGSVGWSGEAVQFLDDRLAAMKVKVPVKGLNAVLVPSEQELAECYTFGQNVAKGVAMDVKE